MKYHVVFWQPRGRPCQSSNGKWIWLSHLCIFCCYLICHSLPPTAYLTLRLLEQLQLFRKALWKNKTASPCFDNLVQNDDKGNKNIRSVNSTFPVLRIESKLVNLWIKGMCFLYPGTNLSGHNVCLHSIWSNLKCLLARVASKSFVWILTKLISLSLNA